jgi:hypothetical protein
MACVELKNTTNVQLYKTVTEKLGDRAGPAYLSDTEWMETTEKNALLHRERLESDLNVYKANLAKEQIRVNIYLLLFLFLSFVCLFFVIYNLYISSSFFPMFLF